MELRKIDTKNIWRVVALSVREDQAEFVATNTQSLLEAYVTRDGGYVALPFALYDGETPVGFVMLGYDTLGEADEPAVAAGNYCIWRLMIDRHFQGKGFGKAALAAVLAYVRSLPCGPARLCWLSYEPENERARALYHAAGFKENGELDGDEIVVVLTL